MFDQVERFFKKKKTVALCSFEFGQRTQRSEIVDTAQVNGCLVDPCVSPFQLLSRASQLASHQRHRDDFAFQRRVAMLA